MSTQAQRDDPDRPAVTRSRLDRSRQRITEIAVHLDAARGGLAEVRDELDADVPDVMLEGHVPPSAEFDLDGVVEDVMMELEEQVSRLRDAVARGDDDLMDAWLDDQAAAAAAEAYARERWFAEASEDGPPRLPAPRAFAELPPEDAWAQADVKRLGEILGGQLRRVEDFQQRLTRLERAIRTRKSPRRKGTRAGRPKLRQSEGPDKSPKR